MLLLLFSGSGVAPFVPSLYTRETWWPALVSVIQGVCPELNGIYRSQSMNRANWLNLIKGGYIKPPYVIIETKQEYQEDWTSDSIAWRQPVEIYYVSTTNAASAVVNVNTPLHGFDITEYTEGRARDISTSIISYSGSGFQIANRFPVVNVSEFNDANRTFYVLKSKYFASQISADLLWGASNLEGTLWQNSP